MIRSLEVQRVGNFRKVWNDNGTCFKPTSVTVWQPEPAEGFWVLGDVMERNTNESDAAHEVTLVPSCTVVVAVRDPEPERMPPLVAQPVDYVEVWNTENTGAKYCDISMWKPIPPPGYVACGVIVTEGIGTKPPAARRVACVHESVAAPGYAQPEDGEFPQLWGTERNRLRSMVLPKNHKFIHAWRVRAVDAGCITPGCFSITSRKPTEDDRRELWCLKKPEQTAHPIEEEHHFRYESFVAPRDNIDARWYVDGESYMSEVADALETAQEEIFMSGWCVSPELFLRRHDGATVEDRLDMILMKMAARGVRVYVLLWYEVQAAVGGLVKSENAKKVLERLHPNIRVVRHPAGVANLFWTHHQKFVVIDQKLAFLGGIDLCFGRFDNADHPLVDDCHLRMRFPGKDYYQPTVKDFDDLENPFNDLVDRTKHPRMPWHDIHARVNREAARDVAQNFLQRWNHHVLPKTNRSKYPFLQPRNVDLDGADAATQPGSCNVQIVRSIGSWSAGLATAEKSIQNCYLDIIANAEHFIYIENQYFISVKNRVADALYERAARAIESGEVFRIIVILPIFTCGGFETGPNACVMKWQYDTISRGGQSLRERIERKLQEQYPPPATAPFTADDYVGFFSLRNLGRLRGEIVGDQVYIHSKLIIVDDRTVLIGTANINDRSMCGDRDSEIACVVNDTRQVEITMNGQPFIANQFAHSLRVNLFMEHLGLQPGQEALVRDPVHESVFHDMWWKLARANTARYTTIFDTSVSDKFGKKIEYQRIEKEKSKRPPEEVEYARQEAERVYSEFVGHLVTFPTQFLCKETLPPTMSVVVDAALFQ